MAEVTIIIDDQEVKTEAGKTIFQAALDADIYIPSLCSHPDLPNFTTKEALTKFGYHVYAAQNGMDALELIKVKKMKLQY